MEENEKTALIPVMLFDQVYQYLLDRPYREVGTLVEEIKNSVQVAELPPVQEAVQDDGKF